MKKSVYSIVLMDDVIRAVDEQAYRLGTSRSNLINQILAEHLSCITPEMRMREIFDTAMEMLGGSLSVMQQNSAALLTLRTALEYKYRPTVSYKIELERVPDEFLGRIRVQLRTQSPMLMELFVRFFEYRAKFEAEALARKGIGRYACQISGNSFARGLINTGKLSETETGEAIGEYIKSLNKAVKVFFADPQNFGAAAPELEKEFENLLEKYTI